MIKILLWIWQLPQNIIGIVMSLFGCCILENGLLYVYYRKLFNSAVCLGDYIIMDRRKIFDSNAKKHEYGHHVQSVYLGWLYIPIVGITSLVRNIYDRCFHAHWSDERRCDWYYGGFPENWADAFGNVYR